MTTDQTMAQFLVEEGEITREEARRLVMAANDAGSHDNITGLCMEF